jgi:hypothetical protein
LDPLGSQSNLSEAKDKNEELNRLASGPRSFSSRHIRVCDSEGYNVP